jgi:hypothetical protein
VKGEEAFFDKLSYCQVVKEGLASLYSLFIVAVFLPVSCSRLAMTS